MSLGKKIMLCVGGAVLVTALEASASYVKHRMKDSKAKKALDNCISWSKRIVELSFTMASLAVMFV